MDELDDDTGRVVSVGNDGGSAVIVLAGEIDLAVVDDIRRGIEPTLSSTPDRLVFDLADVSFMDSSGITVLVEASQRTSAITIRQPSEAAWRVIETTGLADVLPREL